MTDLFPRVAARLFVITVKLSNFYNMSLFLSSLPFRIGDKVRYYFYKNQLQAVGENVYFPKGVVFSHKEIKIGENVRFGPNCTVGKVDFGDNILIAQNVDFLSGNKQHGIDRDLLIIDQPGIQESISIGSDVWIGVKSVVMANIPTGTVIAAGSVVVETPDQSYYVIGGVPAKKIKSR